MKRPIWMVARPLAPVRLVERKPRGHKRPRWWWRTVWRIYERNPLAAQLFLNTPA